MADFDWIFFDCFNTLIDETTDETGLCGIPRRLVEEGWFASEQGFRETYLGGLRALGVGWAEVTLERRLQYCLENAGRRPVGDCDVLLRELLVEWERDYPGTLRPTPGVIDMLEHWRGRTGMAVVSNFYRPGWPQRFLETHGLARYFEFIVDSAIFGHKKPSRRIYEEARRLASVDNWSRILFIGDRLDLDVHPTLELGMQVIHFDRKRTNGATIAAPAPARTIRSWDEFR